MPLLEAMHHRVPIVAYAATAVPETLGDAGLLLDAKDAYTIATAVHRVVTDAALRAQLVAAGTDRLRDFDIDDVAPQAARRDRARRRDVASGRDRPPVRPDARTGRGRARTPCVARDVLRAAGTPPTCSRPRSTRRGPTAARTSLRDAAAPRRRRRVPDGDRLGRRRRGARPRRADRREPPQPHAHALHRGLAAGRRARRRVGPRAAARARRPGPARHRRLRLQRARPPRVRVHPDDRRPDPVRSRDARRRARRPRAARDRARPPGCSSAASRRTRRSTTSSRRSPRTGGSTTPTRACTSSAAGARTATPARSGASSTRLGLDDAVTLTGGVSRRRARRVLPRRRRVRRVQRARGVLRAVARGDALRRPDRRVRVDGGAGDAGRGGAPARRQGSVHGRGRGRPCRRRHRALRAPARRRGCASRARVRPLAAPDPRSSKPSRRRRHERTRDEARGRHPALRRRDPGRRRDRGATARDPPRAAARASRSRRSPRARSTPTTWADHYPSGDDRGRRRARAPLPGHAAAGPPTSTPRPISSSAAAGASPTPQQREWIDKQGPIAPALIDAIARDRRRRRRVPSVPLPPHRRRPAPRRRPLGPAPGRARRADAAAAAVPPGVRRGRRPRVLERSRTPPGRGALRGGVETRASSSGWASTPGAGDADAARAALGLDDRPYLLCLGRVDDGKGARLLAECFARYKDRRGGTAAARVRGPGRQRAARAPRHRGRRAWSTRT